jgi:hypothetical protein
MDWFRRWLSSPAPPTLRCPLGCEYAGTPAVRACSRCRRR